MEDRMEEIASFSRNDNHLVISLHGRIDSSNAQETEQCVLKQLDSVTSAEVDCSDLEYISSAGLRILLKTKKLVPDMTIINTSDQIYNILELTGFTEMINVRKAFRKISIEGCSVIGSGANGTVYRYDDDTIVKVFKAPDALPEIERERELARTAFVLGVPTAISYDIVQVDDGRYGAVFELLNANSYHHLLLTGQKTIDEIAEMSVDLLKIVHSTTPKPGLLPSKAKISLDQLEHARQYLSEEEYQKIRSLYEALPENRHMLHGDLHIKNVMVQDGESLLIDMDTLCTGDPVFEFSGLYISYLAFSELDPEDSMHFFGIPAEDLKSLFEKILFRYCHEKNADPESILKKQQLISSVRMLFYCATGKHMPEKHKEKAITLFTGYIRNLLPELTDLSSGITY